MAAALRPAASAAQACQALGTAALAGAAPPSLAAAPHQFRRLSLVASMKEAVNPICVAARASSMAVTACARARDCARSGSGTLGCMLSAQQRTRPAAFDLHQAISSAEVAQSHMPSATLCRPPPVKSARPAPVPYTSTLATPTAAKLQVSGRTASAARQGRLERPFRSLPWLQCTAGCAQGSRHTQANVPHSPAHMDQQS